MSVKLGLWTFHTL